MYYMYNYIQNPVNGRKIETNCKDGKKIIKKYLQILFKGGHSFENLKWAGQDFFHVRLDYENGNLLNSSEYLFDFKQNNTINNMYSLNIINYENQYKLLFPKNKTKNKLIIMCPQPKVQFFLAPTRPCQERQKVVILLGNSKTLRPDIINKIISEFKIKNITSLCGDETEVNLIYYIEYEDYKDIIDKSLDKIESLIVKSIEFRNNIDFSLKIKDYVNNVSTEGFDLFSI